MKHGDRYDETKEKDRHTGSILLPVLRCLPVQRVYAHQQYGKEQGGGRRLSGAQNRVAELSGQRHPHRPSETDDQNNPQPEEISLELAEPGNEIIFWYEKQTFTLTYVALPDPVYGTPQYLKVPVPDPVTGIPYGGSVELTGHPQAYDDFAVNTDGEWVDGAWFFRADASGNFSKVGWNTKEDLTGEVLTTATGVTEDLTLYGRWEFVPDGEY